MQEGHVAADHLDASLERRCERLARGDVGFVEREPLGEPLKLRLLRRVPAALGGEPLRKLQPDTGPDRATEPERRRTIAHSGCEVAAGAEISVRARHERPRRTDREAADVSLDICALQHQPVARQRAIGTAQLLRGR